MGAYACHGAGSRAPDRGCRIIAGRGTASLRRSLDPEEDRVSRAALLQPGAYPRHFYVEPVVAKPLFEFPVVPRGPDRQRPPWPECRIGGRNAAVVVEAGVGGGRERRRPVVHVEEDGVESIRTGAQREPDVGHFNPNTSISQRMRGERGERFAVPLDYRRDELGDGDDGVGGEQIEDRAQREAHAEPTHEDTRPIPRP